MRAFAVLCLSASLAFGGSIMEQNKIITAPPDFWAAQPGDTAFSNAVVAVAPTGGGSGISAATATNISAWQSLLVTNGYPFMSWDLLQDIPAGFADGTDDGSGGGIDSSTATNIASWQSLLSTNGYPWGSLYDAAGAATAVTNGYPWGTQAAAIAAAGSAATNQINVASNALQTQLDGKESATSNDIDPDRLAGDTADNNLIDSAILPTATRTRTLGYTFIGGGISVPAGTMGEVRSPFSGTITASTIMAPANGSVVIDVWKAAFSTSAHPTDANSITDGNEPELSGAVAVEDTDLGNWSSVTVTAGEVIRFHVDSSTTCTNPSISLTITQ